MPLFATSAERHFAQAVTGLVYVNPFLPERIDWERQALGDAFTEPGPVWSIRPNESGERPNLQLLQQKTEALAGTLRDALAGGRRASPFEVALYRDLVVYVLYYRTWKSLDALLPDSTPKQHAAAFESFAAAHRHFLDLPDLEKSPHYAPAHVFALFFQIRRAFHQIFSHIVGNSLAIARLRAAVWHSLFTHDLSRYQRGLFRQMSDTTTLITGPSGTGKELVARALAFARFVPFDEKSRRFDLPAQRAFFPLNLSALTPTLIESELFGHRRGAFTGALEDRLGYLETCPPLGAVFLDEIGELDAQIQVKLLRVLQQRTFQRLGETVERTFLGKVIAATNRDLAGEISAGRFRTDFYYRLNADMIHTPSLAEQLASTPAELPHLVGYVASRVAPEFAEDLTRDTLAWIDRHLGTAYAWPGNFRELEQCVRNIMIRREYHPPRAAAPAVTPQDALAADILAGNLTADALLQRYCTLLYSRNGSYEQTARITALDRRTVKAKILPALLDELRG
jgi:DNA-binding NtrC family response regulator